MLTVDPQALTLFVEIVDGGNLAQAARNLKMTRANVSYRLAQLEKAAGVQLLRRTPRRVELTEVGMRLYECGRKIRDEVLNAGEIITNLGTELRGRVGISAPSGYGQMVMTPWLIEFKRLYPGISLDVLFENRADPLRDEVDLAVRITPEPPQSLVARSLGDVSYVACASASFAQTHGLPRTLEEFRQAPVITAGVIGRQLRLSAYLGPQRQDVLLDPVLVSEHFPFLREGILAGLGVGLVPDYVVQDKIDTGEVVTALQDYRLSIFGTHMYLMYMPNRHQTRAVRTCMEFLLERARGPEHAALDAPSGRLEDDR